MKNGKLIGMFLCLCSAVIMAFFFAGVYSVFKGGPEKKEIISQLTNERDVWMKRAKELDRYVRSKG